MPLTNKTIAIIGAGNMGEALVRGLLDKGAMPADRLIAADLHPNRLELFARRFGVTVTDDSASAVRRADIVLLAIKPQQMSDLLGGLRETIDRSKLVITIAAGVPTTRIERELGDSTRVVRVMPNTPAQIGEGAAAICGGQHATEGDLKVADAILSAVGTTVIADESYLDAVTALSGTGPAYLFLVAEAMIEAGVGVGLPREMARKLTLQTILGAARLMLESGEEPAELRRKVTSPHGTTEAAMKVMAEGGLVELFGEAIRAAARRSQELSQA